MTKTVAILATLDTKGDEVAHVRSEVQRLGGKTCVIDMGVMGDAAVPADISASTVAERGGHTLKELRTFTNRSETSEVMVGGATAILKEMIARDEVHGVLSLGGTQGTNNAAMVMQDLPYGFPKIIVSTLASGNVSSYVGIKDIVMMPSVGDILGLNPLLRRILTNAAGAVYGMALAYSGNQASAARKNDKPMVAITNLGVLTQGTMRAIKELEARGYETIVFHAVGSGGRAMEQMVKDGLVAGVFDYALGDICDAVLGGLRASDENRLSVTATYHVPQVVVPGGIDHIGIMLSKANDVPAQYKSHRYSYHNPMILVPRPKKDETRDVVKVIAQRLATAGPETLFMIPLKGVSSYSAPGGALFDKEADQELLDALHDLLPPQLKRVEVDASAEDQVFIAAAVEALTRLIKTKSAVA